MQIAWAIGESPQVLGMNIVKLTSVGFLLLWALCRYLAGLLRFLLVFL
jgi:hypothetical protein